MDRNLWFGKRILITGVCGTVGKELLKQVSEYGPDEVIGLDNNESELFFLSDEYRDRPTIRFHFGDIRDRDKLIRKMEGIDIVLHAAALKHVIICEQSPRDAILTNITGVQNVIDAAISNGVQRVIFTSSDKAVNPTNVMGTSKLMGERLMTAANSFQRTQRTIFLSVRFGNILGSRGSVIPLFKRQIAEGGPVTLTDAKMTRFIMTLEEAVRLVLESVFMGRGGEVFITKMPVIRIQDLASIMIDVLAPAYGYDPAMIKIKTVGCKPGEKLYEELMNGEETRRAIELKKYFLIQPALKPIYGDAEFDYPTVVRTAIATPYNSSVEAAMDIQSLKDYLIENKLLEMETLKCVC